MIDLKEEKEDRELEAILASTAISQDTSLEIVMKLRESEVEIDLAAKLATTATKQDTLQEIVKSPKNKELEDSQESLENKEK